MFNRIFLLAIILTALLLCENAHSQQVLGVKGGMNVSSLGGTNSGFTTRVGYNVGLYGSKRYFQELGASMELLVSYQGARNEAFSDIFLNYTYLTLPIVADIYFHESISVELGGQPAYLLRAIENNGGDKMSVKENLNKFDLSGIIGLQFSKPYGSLGIRYVLGVTNTTNASRSTDVKFKNKVLQLYISKNLIRNQKE